MVERIEVPTPFQVGSVNCYRLGRALVDPGPDSDEGWATLVDALDRNELTPGDVSHVLVTHPHPDHFGIANRFAEHGATIIASEVAADVMGAFADRLAYEQSYFASLFVRHGLPEDLVETAVGLPEAYLEFAPDTPVDRPVADGTSLSIAETTLGVERVAGHAPGETIYTFDGPDGEHAIVGDHVLDPITPNPFLEPPETPDGRRPRVLPAYNRSLERLAERGFDRFLPGHRERIDDPTKRIEQLRRFHEHRTEQTLEALVEPRTAAEVMNELFGQLPATEIFPGMSEAIGHLDVLEGRGRVESTGSAPIRYRRT